MPFDQEREKFKFPVFTWNYGVQVVIMGLTLFYGYGAVFWYKQHGLSRTARMALKLCVKKCESISLLIE